MIMIYTCLLAVRNVKLNNPLMGTETFERIALRLCQTLFMVLN